MSKSGFTLVELLITLAIISILAAVGLVVYSNIMKQGNDSKRKSDLRSIQSALEQYYTDQFYYPESITFGSALKNPAATKTYLNVIPEDPTGTTEYAYTKLPSTCDNTAGKECTSYCLYALLESTSTDEFNGCVDDGVRNFAVTLP